jgi:hypothetical protein
MKTPAFEHQCRCFLIGDHNHREPLMQAHEDRMFAPASGFVTGGFPVKNPQKNLQFSSLLFLLAQLTRPKAKCI